MWRFAIYFGMLAILANMSHRFYFAGTWCHSQARMDGKLVVITGANTGIGKTTAFDLAQRGARLILACRSKKKTLPVVNEIKDFNSLAEVTFMELDLSSFASIKRFAEDFLAKEKKLDVLVANAGLISANDDAVFNDDDIEMTMAVNHLGHFYLTGLLKSALISAAPRSRIVVVSSSAFVFANDNAFSNLDDLKKTGGVSNPLEKMNLQDTYLPAVFSNLIASVFQRPRNARYANSKLSNILFVKEFSRRFASEGVNSYSVHPGVVSTDIGWSRATIKSLVYRTLTNWKFLIPFFKTAEEGAQTQICLAVSDDYVNESGGYFADCKLLTPKKPEVNNYKLAADFWQWSEGVIAEAIKDDNYRF